MIANVRNSLVGPQVRPPDRTGPGRCSRGRSSTASQLSLSQASIAETGWSTVGAGILRRLTIVDGRAAQRGRRGDSAAASPVRHVGVAIALLKPEGNELARHVVEGDCPVMHLGAIPAVLRKVRCPRDSRGAVNGGQQGQVATRVVHLTAAQCHGEEIFLEPIAVVHHPAHECLLGPAVLAVVAIHTTGVGRTRSHQRRVSLSDHRARLPDLRHIRSQDRL